VPKTPKVRKVRPLAGVLEHIISAIAEIESFTKGMALPQFLEDKKTTRAVERCLEIISEASRDIPAGIKSKHPAIDWRGMADAGNLYRHGYEHVNPDLVWKTIINDLPSLKALATEMSDSGAD